MPQPQLCGGEKGLAETLQVVKDRWRSSKFRWQVAAGAELTGSKLGSNPSSPLHYTR